MIVVDASAIIALLRYEPGCEALLPRLVAHPQRHLTPASALEVVMVLARSYADPMREAQAYLNQENIAIYPVDAEQTLLAQQAFLTYGKGRHPARLNLGDCFSYAAAKALDVPLLYVGNDFAQTDVRTL